MNLEIAREIFRRESEAVSRLADKLDENFEKAIELIFQCKGRVIITGIGKSGIIGRKITATFNSTGTPAVFMHPSEAIHGDLGIL